MLENYTEGRKDISLFNTYKKKLKSLQVNYEKEYNELINSLEEEIETNLVNRWVHFPHESGNMKIYGHVSEIIGIHIEKEEKGISIECDIIIERKTYGKYVEINREDPCEFWIENIEDLEVINFESVKNLLIDLITARNLINDKE